MKPAAKTLDKARREVERALAAVPRQIPDGIPEAYIGGGRSSLTSLGLKVPQYTAVYKAGFSFSAGDEASQLPIWDHLWKTSRLYEAMALPLVHYGHKKRRDLVVERWPVFKTWVARVDNWAHSDGLSALYAHALEKAPERVLPELERWSASKSPWARRQSVVSLLYYAAARERVLPFPTLAAMVRRQIDHEDLYVQKGVGWTLREMGNVYPRETLKLLGEIAEELSATAFSAATEKLAWQDKERLKQARKDARKRR